VLIANAPWWLAVFEWIDARQRRISAECRFTYSSNGEQRASAASTATSWPHATAAGVQDNPVISDNDDLGLFVLLYVCAAPTSTW